MKKIATAYALDNDLQSIIHIRDTSLIKTKIEEWVGTAQKSKVKQLSLFAKTILNHCDGIINMAKHGLSNGILEGTNGYIKNMRRSAFGYSDFDFFGLLIWEHTHNKASHKKDTSSYVKKIYKPRTRKNNKFASKQTIYIMERDKNGNLLVS